jgi:hypothetical protein
MTTYTAVRMSTTAFAVMDGTDIVAVCENMATARKVYDETTEIYASIPRRFKIIKVPYIKDEA